MDHRPKFNRKKYKSLRRKQQIFVTLGQAMSQIRYQKQTRKEKNRKIGLNLKAFVHQRRQSRNQKDNPENGRKYLQHISDKGRVSRIYKNSYNSTIRTQKKPD